MRYRYYPGGERAASLVDTDITSPILPDELNLFYYDASWRLLEIRTNTGTRGNWSFPAASASFTLSKTRQFVWGERYIDELVCFMQDTAASLNANGTLKTNPTFATLQYALTDRNFSVIGMGFTHDTPGDRIRYEPYGLFRAFPAGDVNGDGTVSSADVSAIMFAMSYSADLDLNMDGSINSQDWSMASSLTGRTLTAGQLSDSGNIVGWCGYLYEESTGMWLARHRWQIPELGRWANRDPIGYAGGGQNLYEYVNGDPVLGLDPSGLFLERALDKAVDWTLDAFDAFDAAIDGAVDWLFDTDTKAINKAERSNHYSICATFRKRMEAGRDEECQTEEQWSEQLFNLQNAYAKEGCGKGPRLTDFRTLALDSLQESLDYIGMIPVVGELADAVNGLIYLMRGNYVYAGLSFMAMVPGLGNAATGVKIGLRGAVGAGVGGGAAAAVKLNPFRRYENHHSYPLFMGGPKKQELTRMLDGRHRRLHRDLNRHLQGQKYTDSLGRNMRPTKSNPGIRIRENFSESQRREAMRDFYNTPRYNRRYQDAANDFFRQFGRR
ncbi:MAG: RHS repeat-associated core domain-containing protein [Phycisphaerales bacterium]